MGRLSRSSGTRALVESCESLEDKALAPTADDFSAGVETLGDLVVALSGGSQQDHLSPNHREVR